MEGKNRQRLTIWAITFTVLSLITAFTMPPEKAKELFAFFKEIIIHLIAT